MGPLCNYPIRFSGTELFPTFFSHRQSDPNANCRFYGFVLYRWKVFTFAPSTVVAAPVYAVLPAFARNEQTNMCTRSMLVSFLKGISNTEPNILLFFREQMKLKLFQWNVKEPPTSKFQTKVLLVRQQIYRLLISDTDTLTECRVCLICLKL